MQKEKLFLQVECLCERLDKGKSPEETAVQLHVVKTNEKLDKKSKENMKGFVLRFLCKCLNKCTVFQSPYSFFIVLNFF